MNVTSNTQSAGGAIEAKVLAAILAGIGVLHFASPKMFDESIPDVLPGNPRVYTYLSGVAEFVLAPGLLIPRTRRVSGLITAAFLVAVYPANLTTVRKYWHRPKPRALAIARLPLQIPMIGAALRVWRGGRRHTS
jgi:uncharacterized membrane protein